MTNEWMRQGARSVLAKPCVFPWRKRPACGIASQRLAPRLAAIMLMVAGLGVTAHADILQWTGTTSTNWATAGNWTNLNTGATNGTPQSTDDVIIDGAPNGRHPTLNLAGGAVTIASLSLGATAISTQTVANGDVDTKRLIVTGNVTIGAYGMLTHPQGNETHRLFLDVRNNLTIASGGRIDVSGKGADTNQGPGKGYNYSAASHGGRGECYQGASATYGPSGPTYGSYLSPTNVGSGGSSPWSLPLAGILKVGREAGNDGKGGL